MDIRTEIRRTRPFGSTQSQTRRPWFTQIHGLNYDETYSLVARYDSLRFIIRLAALRGLNIN